jgi:hypothetical protein
MTDFYLLFLVTLIEKYTLILDHLQINSIAKNHQKCAVPHYPQNFKYCELNKIFDPNVSQITHFDGNISLPPTLTKITNLQTWNFQQANSNSFPTVQ